MKNFIEQLKELLRKIKRGLAGLWGKVLACE
jgi:hypothetical protein